MIDTQYPFNIAHITIHPKTDELSSDGVTIEIKSMAMKMICYFAEHHEAVITRDNLRNNIWQNSTASDHTINNHMYSLRQIFASFDDNTKFFHTVTGNKSGYRLLAQVSQEIDNLSVQSANGSLQDQNSNPNSGSTSSKDNKKTTPSDSINKSNVSSKNKVIALTTVLLTAIIAMILLFPSKPSYDKMSALTTMPGREQNPTISQDGTILVYANRVNRDLTWELYAARLSPSSEIIEQNKIFEAQGRRDNYVSISPNKKLIAFIHYPKNETGIYLADFDENTLSATNERLVIPLKTMNLSPVINWLNDTQFFYNATEAISAPRKIYKYDLLLNKSEPISAPPLNTYGDFTSVVSPNKHWLAIMRSDGSLGYELFLYDLKQKVLITTGIKNTEERLNVSFSDDSQAVHFINQEGFLSSYHIGSEKVDTISSLQHPGYWPLKIPGKNQFIIQQDWGLSSLTNRIIKVSNPEAGGDGKSEIIIDNGLSIRAMAGIDKNGLIFASLTANQKIELWKYQQGKSVKLDAFNNAPQYKPAISLDWLKDTDKALLSINNTCLLIDIKTGKDTPLCPANEILYAGKFSHDGRTIFLAGNSHNIPRSVELGLTGYPLNPMPKISAATTIQQDSRGDFYYSAEPNFDIYHFNPQTGENNKLIERTFVIGRYSNNDFVVVDRGIYYMDRKKIRQNAIYFYNFESQKITYIARSKDNYPHLVVSDDEKFIYIIESYDNDSKLSLIY